MNRSTTVVRCLILLAAILLADSRLPGAVRRVHVPENGISPDIAVGASDTVYFVYGKDRNTSFKEGRNMRWQIADREGKIRDSGDAGALGEKSKATGFVDRRGDFCLVF